MVKTQMWLDNNLKVLLIKPIIKKYKFGFLKIKSKKQIKHVYTLNLKTNIAYLTKHICEYGENPFELYDGYYLRQKKTKFKKYEKRSYTITLNLENKKQHIKKFKPVVINGNIYKQNIETGIVESYTKEELSHSIVNSTKRSYKTFDEIANANEWQFFGTLTFDKTKINRLKESEVYHAYKKYIDNLKHQFKNLRYLTVIERHKKDRAIHFHILFGNATMEQLGLYNSGFNVKHGKNAGQPIYLTTKFKYGFTTFTKIENSEATVNYCKKYLSKTFVSNTDKFKKRFFYSKNCEKPITESKLLQFIGMDADEAIDNYKNVVDLLDNEKDYTYLPNRQFCVKKEIYT